MSKIHSIKVENFKAIDKFEADFKGCTAIVTAGNNKGKTSFLRGVIDRIQFIRPDVKVKSGADAGKGEMILSTGEKFLWEFDLAGKDKLIYTDADGVKQSVTVDLGKRFFPFTFDIDKFLQSPPKEQSKQLQKIVGLDFTDIDSRYTRAYNERTARNLEAERYHVKLSKMLEVPMVLPVDLTELQNKKEAERLRLNELYRANKADNEKLRKSWNEAKDEINERCAVFNQEQSAKTRAIQHIEGYRDRIENLCGEVEGLRELVDLTKLTDFIISLPQAETLKVPAELYPKEPQYIDEMPDDSTLKKIDAEILTASEINVEAKKYSDYIEYKQQTEAAKHEAALADVAVKEIEDERQRMIESVTFPKGILIDANGITVDGFPLDKTQISSSKLYTSALRIAAMNLGEVRALYFDASYLDNKNLSEIQSWAQENDLQLLIERPDRDSGDISYVIVEN